MKNETEFNIQLETLSKIILTFIIIYIYLTFDITR